jgi:hypothetical protein
MKIYKTQEEVEVDIVDGVLKIEGDVKFECDISISAHIDARNIEAWSIKAWDIKAGNIKVWDIDARDIGARDIGARDIKAWDIEARDISYFAVCSAYRGIKCTSIKGRRRNSKHFALDGEVIIKPREVETIEIGGVRYSKQEVEDKLKDIKPI